MNLQPGIEVNVVRAERVGDYRLRLFFSDGHKSLVDFEPFLSRSLNAETRRFFDRDRFPTYRIEWGNLVWGDYEMCFSIEALYCGQLVEVPRLLVAEDRPAYGEKRREGCGE